MATGMSDAEAIERVCGVPFADLYRDWTISLAAEASLAQPPKVGRFLNSGPRFQAWNVDTEAVQKFDAAGSATQFTELRASHSGWYRLQFDGDPLDAWQLTAMRSTRTSPKISLQARWEGEAPVISKTPSRHSPSRLMVETQKQLPAGWQFDEISCELIQEPRPQVWSWPAAGLAMSDSQTFTVPLPTEAAGPEAVIKVRFRNQAGQIAWKWVDVPATVPQPIVQVSRRP
jgi:hypothetical protein